MKRLIPLLLYAGLLSSLTFCLKPEDDFSYSDSDYDYCAQCCSQGRFRSEECARRCNQCYGYNDDAASESRDLNSN